MRQNTKLSARRARVKTWIVNKKRSFKSFFEPEPESVSEAVGEVETLINNKGICYLYSIIHGAPSSSQQSRSRAKASGYEFLCCCGDPACAVAASISEHIPSFDGHFVRLKAMAEPRARAARHKGQMNFEQELRQMLYAFGDDQDPLSETVHTLDEALTDFILEICHGAAEAAHYHGRQKVKVDDFMFTVRRFPQMLGRVQELLQMEKTLKEARKQFDVPEGKMGLERGKGKEGEGKRKRKEKEPGRGKYKKLAGEENEGGDEDA